MKKLTPRQQKILDFIKKHILNFYHDSQEKRLFLKNWFLQTLLSSFVFRVISAYANYLIWSDVCCPTTTKLF